MADEKNFNSNKMGDEQDIDDIPDCVLDELDGVDAMADEDIFASAERLDGDVDFDEGDDFGEEFEGDFGEDGTDGDFALNDLDSDDDLFAAGFGDEEESK